MEKHKQLERDYRNYGKIDIKVYKDMVVTFGEFFDALKQIGYKDESNDTQFRFLPPKGESLMSFDKTKFDGSILSLNDKVWTPNFFTYSQNLYFRYEIDDPDDLAKIIEKNRETAIEKLTAKAA